MPDLHGWITQQIAEVESAAHDHQQASPTWEYDDFVHEVRDLRNGGTVACVYRPGTGTHIALNDPAAVLRRCAADRKILARHTLDPDVHWTPACQGCGTYGDQELSYVDNLNECPELLDLAEGYGLTREQLAALDQPETPARPERPDIPPPVHLNQITKLLSARPASSVPPALRGPNWKPE